MTFKTVLIMSFLIATPAAAEPLRRQVQTFCDHTTGFRKTWECADHAWNSVRAIERAEVLDRSAAIEKDPKRKAQMEIEAKKKHLEAEYEAEMYRLTFPPKE